MPESSARQDHRATVEGSNNTPMTDSPRDDYDSPWKIALERYFPDFMALLYPTIHAEIDWTQGHEFLDKELQHVVRDAELGRRYADKLVKVFTRDGTETWVLVHVEVQGTAESGFTERMYVYNYRLFDRYRTDIVSLAVLADDSDSYRPSAYHRERWGCTVRFHFPIEKLLDWHARWAELEANPNPFALVVMAHLKAQESKDGVTRKGWKLRLVRLLYVRGYTREQILELFRVLDWILQLPQDLEREFTRELMAFEEQAKMPYITSIERLGRQEGEAAMLLRQIARKFGPPAEAVRERIERADSETLLEWSDRILTAQTLDEVLH
jgi:hypothetical protein